MKHFGQLTFQRGGTEEKLGIEGERDRERESQKERKLCK